MRFNIKIYWTDSSKPYGEDYGELLCEFQTEIIEPCGFAMNFSLPTEVAKDHPSGGTNSFQDYKIVIEPV